MKKILFTFLMIIYFVTHLLSQNKIEDNLTVEERKLFRVAYVEYSKNNFNKSSQLFDSLISIDSAIRMKPINCLALGMKATILYKQGKIDSALNIFRMASKCSYIGTKAWSTDFGLIFFEKHNYDSAEYYFKNSISNSPNKLLYIEYYYMAKIKIAKNEKLNAIEFFNKSIEDCKESAFPDRDCRDSYFLRAQIYHSLGKDSLSNEDIKRHLLVYPNDSAAIILQNELEISLNKNEK